MRVIAAIPNFNMRPSLIALLTQLTNENFDQVYVLDDASTDGSADYVETAFPKVKVVRGDKNLGAAANRNRILPHLSEGEFILFLDADLELKSTHIREAVASWFADPKIALVGGLILAADGKPMHWNYGPSMNPMHDGRVSVYSEVAKLTRTNTRVFERVRQMALDNEDTYNFEIQYAEPIRRKVDWVAEGLFAARSDVFVQLGGYDEGFRYHAELDLGVRAEEAGYDVVFDPSVSARHLEIDVRGETRWDDFRKGQYLFYKKHWGMSRRVFERLFPKS